MTNCKNCTYYSRNIEIETNSITENCDIYGPFHVHTPNCPEYKLTERNTTMKNKYDFNYLNDCRLCKHYSEEFLSDENHTENFCNLLGHCCFSTSTEARNCPYYELYEDQSKYY